MLRISILKFAASAIHHLKQEETKEAFRRGFAKACLGGVTAEQYEKATRLDFESDEALHAHLLSNWNSFYPDSNPIDWAEPTASFGSFERYRGWRQEEGDTAYYTVERADGAAVVRVTLMKLVGRVLHITYELSSPSIYDGFARQLIRQKILTEVCLDSYAARADAITYTSSTTGSCVTVSYRAGP
ncbi:MAG: hypothetical protein QM756_45775 [Polyangiaceae bacterium]